jgi:hypothetical protein
MYEYLGGIYEEEDASQTLKMKIGNLDSSLVLRIQQSFVLGC